MEYTLTKHYKAIIWDWNGTLLDDLEICIDAMNMMLHKRGYKLLEKQHYKEIFTFPVRDYYERVGFDFEKHDWETIALEFIRDYRDLIHKSLLHDRVNEVVSYFQTAGKRQFILSAMHQDFLVETISARLDPSKFEIIAGLGDH
ncbi:MAG: HAD hydrolase-like protein, partial [Bacteroidales bacterium]